jgi:hypothetical protein
MVYKIIFSFFILWILSLTTYWDYDKYIDYNDVFTKYVVIESWSGSDDIIEQRAWYYYVIDSITVSNDCINMWCSNNSQLWGIFDWTGQIALYNNINYDSSYVVATNTIIKHNINIINSSDEVWLMYNINYHYVRYNESILANIIYYVKDNTLLLDEWLSYIIIYILYFYFFIFFAKKWYKIWSSYFNKK